MSIYTPLVGPQAEMCMDFVNSPACQYRTVTLYPALYPAVYTVLCSVSKIVYMGAKPTCVISTHLGFSPAVCHFDTRCWAGLHTRMYTAQGPFPSTFFSSALYPLGSEHRADCPLAIHASPFVRSLGSNRVGSLGSPWIAGVLGCLADPKNALGWQPQMVLPKIF